MSQYEYATSYKAINIAGEPKYNQISQTMPLKFVTMAQAVHRGRKKPTVFVETSTPFLCRDYLNDFQIARATMKDYSVYGYNPKTQEVREALDKNKFSLEEYVVMQGICWKLVFPTNLAKQHFEQIFPTLVHAAIPALAPYCRITSYLDQPEQHLVLEVSSLTVHNPVLTSLLSYICRVACYGQQWEDGESLLDYMTRFSKNNYGQEASLFESVPREVWDRQVLGSIATLSLHKIYAFNYLTDHLDDVMYLHNCSGFFSQVQNNRYVAPSKFRLLLAKHLAAKGIDASKFFPNVDTSKYTVASILSNCDDLPHQYLGIGDIGFDPTTKDFVPTKYSAKINTRTLKQFAATAVIDNFWPDTGVLNAPVAEAPPTAGMPAVNVVGDWQALAPQILDDVELDNFDDAA